MTQDHYHNICIETAISLAHSDDPSKTVDYYLNKIDKIIKDYWGRLGQWRVGAYRRFGTDEGTNFLSMKMELEDGERFSGEIFPRWETGRETVQLAKDLQPLYD
jgi:hypothetical protein